MNDQERAVMQQALEAMLNFPDDISDEMFESIRALRAALAQGCYIAQDMTRQEYERLYPDAEEEVK